LIVSFWQHYFAKSDDGALIYRDRLSRWRGAGNELLREHLRIAYDQQLPIRAIVASTPNPDRVDAGEDGSKIKKEFHLLDRMVGQVAEFDSDYFTVRFTSMHH
jgi:hypothetical protein